MPPQARQTHVQQLQDAKAEIGRMRAQLDNLSNVQNELRESDAERANLRSTLEQVKGQLQANPAKTRVTDLEKSVNELSIQLRRAREESDASAAMVNAYEQKLANVSTLEQQLGNAQNTLRHAIEERDSLAGRIQRIQQNAGEAVRQAEGRVEELSSRIRQLTEQNANYAAVIRDLRQLLQTQPDVLAAVRQKVGLG